MKVSIAKVLQAFFQRTHFILALADMDKLVVGRSRDLAFPTALLLSLVVRSVVGVKR